MCVCVWRVPFSGELKQKRKDTTCFVGALVSTRPFGTGQFMTGSPIGERHALF